MIKKTILVVRRDSAYLVSGGQAVHYWHIDVKENDVGL